MPVAPFGATSAGGQRSPEMPGHPTAHSASRAQVTPPAYPFFLTGTHISSTHLVSSSRSKLSG